MPHHAPVISPESLNRDRRRVVSKLVAPLAATTPVDVRQVGPGTSSYSLGALPRLAGPPRGFNPEDPLVPMPIPGFHFNYYETWRLRQDGDYEMQRAYLHIHRFPGGGRPNAQVLSLHCDPALPEGDVHYLYKRGPHLHIGGAEPAIERAHLALRLGDETLGGRDIEAMTRAMREAIEMIVQQIVPCWQRT